MISQTLIKVKYAAKIANTTKLTRYLTKFSGFVMVLSGNKKMLAVSAE